MKNDHSVRGGFAAAVLRLMDAWEANLVLNLRLWCDGPKGQAAVWNEYRKLCSGRQAQAECRAFEHLLNTLIDNSYRPLVRHKVGCACVGVDESIFVNLVRTASAGHLTDAALIATLIAGPAKAEHIAVLAGEVGASVRRMHAEIKDDLPELGANVSWLH